MKTPRKMLRQQISRRVATFLANAAKAIDVVGIELSAHGLHEQQEKLRTISDILRHRKSQ